MSASVAARALPLMASSASAATHVTPRQLRLFVEANVDAVAVLYFIVAALQPQPGPLPRLGFAACLEQFVPWNDLGANEPLRQIAVDLAGGIHRLVPRSNGPGTHLVLS